MSISEEEIGFESKTEAKNKSVLLFEDYRANGGTLNEEIYETVLDEASQNHPIDEAARSQISSMIRNSNLTFKDFEKTTNLYNVLRRDVVGGSDQKTLAEALKMSGDMDALNQLVKSRPNIFNQN